IIPQLSNTIEQGIKDRIMRSRDSYLFIYLFIYLLLLFIVIIYCYLLLLLFIIIIIYYLLLLFIILHPLPSSLRSTSKKIWPRPTSRWTLMLRCKKVRF